ncbi:hypothetical protein G6011_07966 [Alternaria panax]|uniref:Uncharacterized protein n=1 Tax=Alternaria panax TaxID=48097 RepID=A0AAD4F8F6_9PLEO|nr:hypothetical protein G6011_07966 [Alternaria panax]
MRIYSLAHGIEFEYDPEEPPTTFHDPNLPSTFAYGAEFFGELVSYKLLAGSMSHEIPDTVNVAPWSLEELDYMKDAPSVHTGTRIDGQVRLPDYHAQCSYTESWEEGLQEIEDFDWLAEKEDEQHIGASDNDIENEEKIRAASSSGADPIEQNKGLDLLNEGAAHLHRKKDSPTACSEDKIQESKDLPPANGTAYITGVTKTIALPPSINHVKANSPIAGGQHIEAQDALNFDKVAVVADAERPDISPETEGDATAGKEIFPMSDTTANQGEYASDNMVAETGPDPASDGNDEVEASVVTPAPASQYHEDRLKYESGLQAPPQILEAPEASTKDLAIGSELPAVRPPPNGRDDGEATYSVLEASNQPQTQDDEPKAYDQLQDDLAVHAKPTTEILRSTVEGLSKTPAFTSHLEPESLGNALKFGSEHGKIDGPVSSALDEDNSSSETCHSALSRVEKDVDGPWQAQLQIVADEVSFDGLSELLPPGYRNCIVHPVKTSPETTEEGVSVPAQPPPVVLSSEQQLENSPALPPLTFASKNDAAANEVSGIISTESSEAEENAPVTQPAYRSSGPSSPFDVELSNASDGDHMAVLNSENSKSQVEIPKNNILEDRSPRFDQEMMELLVSTVRPGSPRHLDSSSSLGSPTPIPAPKAQPIPSHKRSKPSKQTENASETESDAPPRKRARQIPSTEQRANGAEKLSKGLVQMEDALAASPIKIKNGAVKLKKEAAHVKGMDEDSSAEIPSGSTPKLDLLAQNEHSGPSRQAPITKELDMILDCHAEILQPDHENNDADMEEHFIDIEVPVTPSKRVPPVDTVPSTPRSRPKISTRELQGISPPTYRNRPSKATRDMLSISLQLFKLDTSEKLMSSTNAFEQSPAVPRSNSDLSALDKGSGATGSTLDMVRHFVAKPKAAPAKTKKQEKSQALAPDTINAFSARPAKKQKAEPADDIEEDLFTASKIDTTKPAPLPELASPPRDVFTNARRATRSKKTFDRNVDVTPAIEDSLVITDGDLDDENPSSSSSESDDVKDAFEEEDGDFKDAQETIEAPYKNKEADDDYSDTSLPASKNHKLKNTSLMLRDYNVGGSSSRTNTPAPSTASSTPAPTTNRYGFKPPHGPRTPRIRAGRKAAVGTAAPTPSVRKPAPAPKAKVPAKRKAKTARSDTVIEVEEENQKVSSAVNSKAPGRSKAKRSTFLAAATPEPPARKTRRAHAMEDEIIHAREEDEKVAKENVRAATKAKLRRKN